MIAATLLLVFFVWTANFRIAEQILPSELSAVQGTEPSDTSEPPPPEADFDNVVVCVLYDEAALRWQVNEVTLASLTEVHSRLEVIAGIKRDAPVIVHPDGDVALGDVIDVYDAAKRSGFEQIQFATSERI